MLFGRVSAGDSSCSGEFVLLSTRDLRFADRGVMLAFTVPSAVLLPVSSVGLLAIRGDAIGVQGPTPLPDPVGRRGADGLSSGVFVALLAKRGVSGGRVGFDSRLRSDDMGDFLPVAAAAGSSTTDHRSLDQSIEGRVYSPSVVVTGCG